MTGRFDLRQLRYFVAVAEELNFRRAAERLHISQPPLSRAIAELEGALGAALFARSTVRVTLTPAGDVALGEARKVLAAADSLAASVRRAVPAESTPLRVGITVAVPPGSDLTLETAWRTRLAPRRIAVSSGASPDLLRKLRRGALDFALVGLPAALDDLSHIVVGAEPLVAALPAAHPAARKRQVRLADITELPIFWWPRAANPAYYDHVTRHFAECGFSPRFVTVEPAQTVTLERIARGEGFTLVNRSRTRITMRGLAYRPLLDARPLAIRMALVWQGKGGNDAAARTKEATRLAAAACKVLPSVEPLRRGRRG